MSPEAGPSLADFASLRYAAGGHPLTQLVSQRLGALLAWASSRMGLSPSTVTLLGLAVFLAAAYFYATLGVGAGSALTCIVLLEAAYGLDCADGQLARATNRTSDFGAWLDVACDYVRSVAVAAGALCWLGARGLPLADAVGCAGLFLAGAAVHIHTATALRGDPASAPLRTSGAGRHLRWAITVLCDTATVLLLLGILREAPLLLAAYLAGMGVLYLAISAYLARARFSAAR